MPYSRFCVCFIEIFRIPHVFPSTPKNRLALDRVKSTSIKSLLGVKGLSPLKKWNIALQIYRFLGLFSLYFHVALCKAIKSGWKLSENKMFQEQN